MTLASGIVVCGTAPVDAYQAPIWEAESSELPKIFGPIVAQSGPAGRATAPPVVVEEAPAEEAPLGEVMVGTGEVLVGRGEVVVGATMGARRGCDS